MQKLSLKTKIAILISILFLVTFITGTFLAEKYSEHNIKEIITEQQRELLAEIAMGIDFRLKEAQDILVRVSKTISPDSLQNPAEAQRTLETIVREQYFLKRFFDTALVIYSTSGKLLAEYPLDRKRIGKNFSYKEYIKVTLKTGQPYISKPYISSKPPPDTTIMFTAPVRNRQKEMVAIFGGSVSLTKENFLGALARIKIGKTGYAYMVGADNIIVIHPDKKNILAPLSSFDKNISSFVETGGRDSSDEITDSKGNRVIIALSHLHATNWIIAAHYPAKEAYTPLYEGRWYFWAFAIVALCLTVFATHMLIRRYLSPLTELDKQIRNIGRTQDTLGTVSVDAEGEIGELARSFNDLLHELSNRDLKLKAALDELTEREARLSTILNSSNYTIISTNQDGIIQTFNATAERLLGYKAEEVIGKATPQIVHDSEEIMRRAQELSKELGYTIKPGFDVFVAKIRGGAPDEHEWTYIRKDGTRFPVLLSATVICDKEGKVIGFLGIGTDITEKKAAAELNNRYNFMINSMTDLISFIDTDYRYRAVNKAWCKTFNTSKEDVIGKTPSAIWGAEAFRAIVSYLDRCFKGEIVSYQEWINLGVYGRSYCDITMYPYTGEQDHTVNAVVVTRNITERLKAEEQIRKLSRAVEHSSAVVLITDTEGRIEYVNPKFTQVTGYTSEEAIGKNPSILKSGGIPPEEYQALWNTIKSGNEWQGIFYNKKKDGTFYWVSTSISPLRDLKGDITHFVGVQEDITPLKNTEEELQRAKQIAEEANKAKSDFLASMSHEIRTPMNAIIGMAELLLETDLDPDQHKYVEVFRNAGENLLNIINDILDFSKVEGGRLELEATGFNLEDIIEKTCEVMAIRAHDKGLELVCFIPPDVPRCLIGDPVRLGQVLTNLIGNAVKFTERGEIVVGVKLQEPELQEPDLKTVCLIFSIRDTGIGIPEGKTETIFDKFIQVDSSTTRKYGGTGLGLSISKNLIGMMGGNIWVESKPGAGSTFFFTACFPVQKEPKSELAETPGLELKGLRLLIIDDNATSRMILIKTLSSWGCMAREIDDGIRGITELEKARESGAPYDIVLLDYYMPNMDGLEVARMIRNNRLVSDTPIILLASDFARGHNERFMEFGIDGHLLKPIKRTELKAMILAVLGKDRDAIPDYQSQLVQPEAEMRPLNILIAEDSEDNRLLIKSYLKKTPYNIDFAENGEIAYAKFRESVYDLVLMDIQMPVMDGYAATKKIRDWENVNRREHIPVIALTAHALKQDEQKSREAGCDGHLTKPIKKSSLLEAIARFTTVYTQDRDHDR